MAKKKTVSLDSPEVKKLVDEYGELSMQIDKIKAELEPLQKQFKEKDDQLLEILTALDELDKRHLEGEKFLVSIKRAAYTSVSFKYKEAFEHTMEKVNGALKKQFEEILNATKTIKTVAASLGVQKKDKVNEQEGDETLSTIKNDIEKITKYLGVFIDHMKKLNDKMSVSEVKKSTKDIVSEIMEQEILEFLREKRISKTINEEKKIEINDDEDYSWWSDRYKEENGFRPRMSNKELENWANSNFELKGKRISPKNKPTKEESKKMTKAQKSKESSLHKKVPKKPFEKQYGERGEDVYYATMKKQAMKKK